MIKRPYRYETMTSLGFGEIKSINQFSSLFFLQRRFPFIFSFFVKDYHNEIILIYQENESEMELNCRS